MTRTDLMNRSGIAAIAAAFALSSTPVFSQDIGQDGAVPPPPVSETPISEPDTVGVTTPVDELAPLEPAETEPEAVEAVAAPKPQSRGKVATTATAAKAPAMQPTEIAATEPAATEAQPEDVDAIPAPQVAESSVTEGANVSPVDEEVGYGLGAFALLAFGVGAVAITRRRRDEFNEDEEVPVVMGESASKEQDFALEPTPMADLERHFAMPVATYAGSRSAFAWGEPIPSTQPPAGESHVERAMRGPTPDNPSLSLRKRLKRAAFFEKRDREVAEGRAEPVDARAGLPQRLNEEHPQQARRELEPA